MAGFAYLVIFDALGMLNIFVSNVVVSNHEFREANLRRPFGYVRLCFIIFLLPVYNSVLTRTHQKRSSSIHSAQRYEVVFALGTTIYLLFVGMYTTKESIEHLMLEEAGEKAGAQHEESEYVS